MSLEVTYGYLHGYRHLAANETDAALPFGFGLSYTEVTYDGIELEAPKSAADTGARLRRRGTRCKADGARPRRARTCCAPDLRPRRFPSRSSSSSPRADDPESSTLAV